MNIKKLSLLIDDALKDRYSRGMIFNHNNYSSCPDSESVLGPMNHFQSDEHLREFSCLFKHVIFDEGYVLLDMKIAHPHRNNGNDNWHKPPHPSMTINELNDYIWPNANLTINNEDYNGHIYLNTSKVNKDFKPTLNKVLEFKVNSSATWYKYISWPMMVGSNRCNMNEIRKYLNDTTEILDPDTNMKTTMGKRSRYILDYFKCEDQLPDGYFINGGRIKAYHINDKLQLNYIYTIEDKKVTNAINNTICEIRSIGQIDKVVHHQMILASSKLSSKMTDTFKLLTCTARINIYRILKGDEGVNIFTLANYLGFYGCNNIESNWGANKLLDTILMLSSNNIHVRRIANNSYETCQILYNDAPIAQFTHIFNMTLSESDDDNMKLISTLLTRVLPHCEEHWVSTDDYSKMTPYDSGTPEDIFNRKIYIIAIMFIQLVRTIYLEIPILDRKSFIYKRWSTITSEYKEYIKDNLLNTVSFNKTDQFDKIPQLMKSNRIPNSLTNAKDAKFRSQSGKEGLIEPIPLQNVGTFQDMITSVKIITSKTQKSGMNTSKQRMIHTSQFGQQCFVKTPENSNVGLSNAMAEACLISIDIPKVDIINLYSIINQYYTKSNCLLCIDGTYMGFVKDELYNVLLNMRRSGKINFQIGLAKHILMPGILTINIRLISSRPIFPVLIVGKTYENIVNPTYDTIDYMLNNGYLEFIDGYELSYNCVVAPWLKEVKETSTHALILPGHMLSIISNCLSFISHTPAARGTYAGNHLVSAISKPFKWSKYRFDHETNEMLNLEVPIMSTKTSRRINMNNHGINAFVLSRPNNGSNTDDGIDFSETFAKSGRLNGKYYSILSVAISGEKYNFLLNKDTLKFTFPSTYLTLDKGKYISENIDMMWVDPDYSNGIINPYGKPVIRIVDSTVKPKVVSLTYNTIDIYPYNYISSIINYTNDPEIIDAFNRTPNGNNVEIKSLITTKVCMFDDEPGKYYIWYGGGSDVEYRYRDINTNHIISKVIYGEEVNSGKLPWQILIRNEDNTRYTVKRKYSKYALCFIEKQLIYNIYTSDLMKCTVNNVEYECYGPPNVNICQWEKFEPKQWTSTVQSTTSKVIFNKRLIKRGDAAVKFIDRAVDSSIYIKDETFDITSGTIETIHNMDSLVKIKTSMNVFPEPGNKYCFFYSQKGVNARIVPDSDMPYITYKMLDIETGQEREYKRIPDMVFNPLSFPSRTTVGMLHEMYIGGTIGLLFEIKVNNTTFRELYYNALKGDHNIFNDVFHDSFKTKLNTDIVSIIYDLTDTTFGIHNDNDKLDTCKHIRRLMGLNDNAVYDTYVKINYSDEDDNIVYSDYQKSPTGTMCGIVYYSALRHLVKNKRRARGRVGKKDAISGQPAKGKRNDGGLNAGLMEIDAMVNHGAISVVHERLSKMSDERVLYKCIHCGGLLHKEDDVFICNDCLNVVQYKDIIKHKTVQSWEIFKMYLRSVGMDAIEVFDMKYNELLLDALKQLNPIKHKEYIIIPSKNVCLYVDTYEDFNNRQKLLSTIESRKTMMSKYKLILIYESYFKEDWRSDILYKIDNLKEKVNYIGNEYNDTLLINILN